MIKIKIFTRSQFYSITDRFEYNESYVFIIKFKMFILSQFYSTTDRLEYNEVMYMRLKCSSLVNFILLPIDLSIIKLCLCLYMIQIKIFIMKLYVYH